MERHHCLKFFPITTKSTIQPKKWRTHSLIFSSEITSQLFNQQYGIHTWKILPWIFCNTKAFSQLVWPKFAILFKKNFCSLNGKLMAYSKFPSLLYVTNLSSYMTHTQSNFFWKALCIVCCIWRFGLVGGNPFLNKNIYVPNSLYKIRVKSGAERSRTTLFRDLSRLRSKKFYVQNENKANSAQLELELWLSLAINPIKQWKQSFFRIFWPQKIWRFGLVGGDPFLITNLCVHNT